MRGEMGNGCTGVTEEDAALLPGGVHLRLNHSSRCPVPLWSPPRPRYLPPAGPGAAITSSRHRIARPGGPQGAGLYLCPCHAAAPVRAEPPLGWGDGGPRPGDDTRVPLSPRRGPLTLPGGSSSARLANAIKL